MLRTLSYVGAVVEEIRVGETYYFGQLWDGDGDGVELLESGAIAVYNEEAEDWEVVDFEIVEESENLLETLVRAK